MADEDKQAGAGTPPTETEQGEATPRPLFDLDALPDDLKKVVVNNRWESVTDPVVVLKSHAELEWVPGAKEQSRQQLMARHGSLFDAAMSHRLRHLKAALPYLHQKQPMASKEPPYSLVNFKINLGNKNSDGDGAKPSAKTPAPPIFDFDRENAEDVS